MSTYSLFIGQILLLLSMNSLMRVNDRIFLQHQISFTKNENYDAFRVL